MTTVAPTVFACPWCHLRFGLLSELRYHVDAEHPRQEPAPDPGPQPTGRLVVPMDPDRPVPVALAVAEVLATQLGAALDLVSAPGLAQREGAEAFLGARVREVRRHAPFPPTSAVLPGEDPATAILSRIVGTGADLACMGTRAAHGPGHLLFGSVAEAVVLGADVPVLLAGPHVQPPPRPFRRVVVAVDGTPGSRTALAAAVRLHAATGAELVLYEVVEPGRQTGDAYEGAELVRIAHSLPHPPAAYEVLHGTRPHRVLAEYADRDDDAIVVTGTRGRDGRRMAVGSVARGVVAATRHPTLVVPPTTDVDRFLAPGAPGATS